MEQILESLKGEVWNYKTRDKAFKIVGKKLGESLLEKDEKKAQVLINLLWKHFGDYINSFNFRYVSYKTNTIPSFRKKLLYWLDGGDFYKIGVTNNINKRIIDLKFEFDNEFKIIACWPYKGHLESKIHAILAQYRFPIIKKNGKRSGECFVKCKEVENILNKLNEKWQN